jgi:hypothetical protein
MASRQSVGLAPISAATSDNWLSIGCGPARRQLFRTLSRQDLGRQAPRRRPPKRWRSESVITSSMRPRLRVEPMRYPRMSPRGCKPILLQLLDCLGYTRITQANPCMDWPRSTHATGDSLPASAPTRQQRTPRSLARAHDMSGPRESSRYDPKSSYARSKLRFAVLPRWTPITILWAQDYGWIGGLLFTLLTGHLSRHSSGSAPQRTAWYRRRPQALRYRRGLIEQV